MAAFKLCYNTTIAGFDIELRQLRRNSFTVVYGIQIREHLDYTAAATELGAAIMHALSCEAKLDNRS